MTRRTRKVPSFQACSFEMPNARFWSERSRYPPSAVMKAASVEILPFPDQARFEAMMPDFLGEWVAAMGKAGKGAEAEAMAKRWKSLR